MVMSKKCTAATLEKKHESCVSRHLLTVNKRLQICILYDYQYHNICNMMFQAVKAHDAEHYLRVFCLCFFSIGSLYEHPNVGISTASSTFLRPLGRLSKSTLEVSHFFPSATSLRRRSNPVPFSIRLIQLWLCLQHFDLSIFGNLPGLLRLWNRLWYSATS